MRLTNDDLDYDSTARLIATQAALDWLDEHEDILRSPLIVIINMREPSYRKRCHVYEISSGRFVRNHHTTHGSGSCSWHTQALATKFSNTPESKQTSLGMMRIRGEYIGKHGKSLVLQGLEDCNSNVEKRHVVLHQANYVRDAYILQMGRAGCSWGCFAFDPTIWFSLRELLSPGTLLYCYYPTE